MKQTEWPPALNHAVMLPALYLAGGADKSLARPTAQCIFLMVRIFRLMLILLYV